MANYDRFVTVVVALAIGLGISVFAFVCAVILYLVYIDITRFG